MPGKKTAPSSAVYQPFQKVPPNGYDLDRLMRATEYQLPVVYATTPDSPLQRGVCTEYVALSTACVELHCI